MSLRCCWRSRAVLVLAVVLAGTGWPLPCEAEDNPVLVGTVTRVVDGDTLVVQLASGPIRVRLDSIDAPESDQPGGARATMALTSLVDHHRVELEVVTQDRYERLVAQVTVNGTSINETLVKEGHVWTYRRYARNPDYCRWEETARREKRGLWSLPTRDWIYPSEWRRLRRREITTVTDYSQETAAGCIGALGQR